jgi:hypothetical protein
MAAKTKKMRMKVTLELEGATAEALRETKDLLEGDLELEVGEQWRPFNELLADWLLVCLPESIEDVQVSIDVLKTGLPGLFGSPSGEGKPLLGGGPADLAPGLPPTDYDPGGQAGKPASQAQQSYPAGSGYPWPSSSSKDVLGRLRRRRRSSSTSR